MTSSLEIDGSQAFEGSPQESDSSFNQYTGRGSVEVKSLLRKQDLRIIPLCAMVYLLNFLDRSNIGTDKPFAFSHISPCD